MGSNVNNVTSGGHNNETIFSSKDIVSGTKAGQKKEYFVKVKEKSFGKRFSEWFHKHNKKLFIALCAIIVVAIATLVIIKIVANNQSGPEETIDWYEETSKVEDEINQYLEDIKNSDSEAPYTETIKHFEDLYDAETDPDKKFALLIAQVRYLIENHDYDEAEKLITYASIPDLDDEKLYIFALEAYNLYTEKEDQEKIDYYYSIIEDSPEEVKSNDGGGA